MRGGITVADNASVRQVDVRECRNLKSVERTVLFALASAVAEGRHIVKITHGDKRVAQIRTFLRSLLRRGEIRLFIEGTKLGDDDDPGSLYLRANFGSETSDASFWERGLGVTVVCV